MLVEPTVKAGEVLSPFVIKNQTGMDILLKLDNTFEVSWFPAVATLSAVIL